MKYIPIELINKILTYREKHPLSIIMNDLINSCYKKDVHPILIDYSIDGYYHYSFYNWYFKIIIKKYIFIFLITPVEN